MILLTSILSLFLIQTQQTLPPNKQAKATATAQNSKNETNRSQIPTPPPEAKGDTKQTTDDSNKNQNNSTDSPKRTRVEFLNAGSTVVIAIFTAFTFAVFLYQIKVTHDAERAWILINEWRKPETLEWWDVNPRVAPQTYFTWIMKNSGRSPARILKIQLRFHFVENLNNLPASPNYGNGGCMLIDEIPTDGTFIAPSGELTIRTYFEGADGKPSSPTQDQMDAVRGDKAFLIAYGSILYKDAFKRKHRTRFCHVYT